MTVSPGRPGSTARSAAGRWRATAEATIARFRSADGLWLIALAGMVVAAALRIGLFDLVATVAAGERLVELPNVFATVDHPFHATRAETLRRALADGQLLRWVPHHQGGYPVEFYPLGVPYLDVLVWAVLLGAFPIVAVHKLVIGAIFFAPAVAFVLMARHDRWPISTAVMATAGHLLVSADWWHGGYTELVQWGLVTNVAANVALLFTLIWLTGALDAGGGSIAGAALAASFAIYSNPRILITLAVVGVAVAGAALLRHGGSPPILRRLVGRLGLVAGLTALLAAPELLALVRFADLYHFVRYESYADLGDYLAHSVEAVSRPVFVLGIAGAALGWRLPDRPVTRAAAVALSLHILVTLVLGGAGGQGVVEQLEATRLMPFQRLLTIYLAAVALAWAIDWVGARVVRLRAAVVHLVPLVAIVVLAVATLSTGDAAPLPGAPGATQRALYDVETAAQPTQADFLAAVQVADEAAAEGTSLLVIGSALSWHQRLWAPLETERFLLYDNWLWLWHAWHQGAAGYVPGGPHHYPNPELALDPAYLARHAIGAVIVADTQATGFARLAASSSVDLTRIAGGRFEVYTVDDPAAIVTVSDRPATDIHAEPGAIAATIDGDGGQAVIRQTWYPRWRAELDGEPVAIGRGESGYLTVDVPAGQHRLELTYAVDGLDWLGRLAAVIGLIATSGALIGPAIAGRRRSGAAGMVD